MLTLHPMDSFRIAGRGIAHSLPAPFAMNRANPELIGQTVLIHGKPVEIVGVERFAINKAMIDEGEAISVLVRT